MKADATSVEAGINQVLVKGTCPVCGSLKDFQWTLVETTRPQPDLRLCNFHGWAMARARGKLSPSTPGETVTNVFLEMRKKPLAGKVSSEPPGPRRGGRPIAGTGAKTAGNDVRTMDEDPGNALSRSC
jgi:hypothetical protein